MQTSFSSTPSILIFLNFFLVFEDNFKNKLCLPESDSGCISCAKRIPADLQLNYCKTTNTKTKYIAPRRLYIEIFVLFTGCQAKMLEYVY